MKAYEDGTISNDEQALLEQLNVELEDFENFLLDAELEGILSKSEIKILKKKRTELFQGVRNIVEEDDDVTEDELILIKLLIQLMNGLRVESKE